MAVNTATGGTVCAEPATVATERYVVVKFPSTYTLHETETRWALTVTNLPLSATAWPGVTGTNPTLADNTAKTITVDFNSGGGNDLVVGTLYCFNFTDDGTNPAPLTTAAAAASSQQASIETRTAVPAQVDFSGVALANIGDDQIVVTAVVPPIFQFAITPDNTEAFGNLDPTSITNTGSGTVVTINTNAKGGWVAWAKDSDQGLASTTTAYTIPTTGTINAAPNQLTAGTPGYVMDVDATDTGTSACTAAADAEYAATQPATHGGTLSANFQPIGACTGGTSNGDQLTLVEYATIATTTPAATDYSDIITVVGAGNF
jgi:hypothetical protein